MRTPGSEANHLLHYLGQVGVAFADHQPDGGGRYQLVLTRMYSPAANDHFAGAPLDGTYVMVSWVNHGAYAFELFPSNQHPLTPDYVASKFSGCTPHDAKNLSDLLEQIQVQAVIRGMRR